MALLRGVDNKRVSREVEVTDEIYAIREPTGDVCGTVIDDGQAHAGERWKWVRHIVLHGIIDVFL